jgi:hypothetical protein
MGLTTMVITSMTMGGTPTAHVVHRGTMIQLQIYQVLEFSGLKSDQVRKDIIKRVHLGLGGHGDDEGAVVSREFGKKIGENLLITERSIGSNEHRGEARDLA